jgi:AraC family transcriptional regulator, transcriptional activator FtrA
MDRYIEPIRARYPHITLQPDVLYVDEGSVLTAAGSAAGIDLCLHVVRRDTDLKPPTA